MSERNMEYKVLMLILNKIHTLLPEEHRAAFVQAAAAVLKEYRESRYPAVKDEEFLDVLLELLGKE